MKEHIKTLPHHPKRVIIISLIIAIAIGTFGYVKINKKSTSSVLKEESSMMNASFSSHNLTLGFLTGGRIKSVSVKAGDIVKKGQVLATLDAGNTLGALTQAKAAYSIAENNYQKVINGATGTAIDVARAAVNTAQVNLDGVTNQQNILVKNAYKNLLNSTPEAIPVGTVAEYTSPIISGNYSKESEGKIVLSLYYGDNGASFSASGIVNGSGYINKVSPQPIGDSGLYIKLPSDTSMNITNWIIEIPNKKATNYITNNNAYQAALETKNQVIGNAQASLDQAKASLTALVTAARPEDVAIAKAQMNNAAGAVQIAEAAFQNTIIVAPSLGTVVSVSITPGQIAIPNASAIEFTSLTLPR